MLEMAMMSSEGKNRNCVQIIGGLILIAG